MLLTLLMPQSELVNFSLIEASQAQVQQVEHLPYAVVVVGPRPGLMGRPDGVHDRQCVVDDAGTRERQGRGASRVRTTERPETLLLVEDVEPRIPTTTTTTPLVAAFIILLSEQKEGRKC
jgi:hypothetical protein